MAQLFKKKGHACPLSSIKIIILTTISAVSTALADDIFFFFVLAFTSRKKYTSLINMYVYLILYTIILCILPEHKPTLFHYMLHIIIFQYSFAGLAKDKE